MKSCSSNICSAVPSAQLELFSLSNGAAALKGSITYGTTQRRSESESPAIEAERSTRGSEDQEGQN